MQNNKVPTAEQATTVPAPTLMEAIRRSEDGMHVDDIDLDVRDRGGMNQIGVVRPRRSAREEEIYNRYDLDDTFPNNGLPEIGGGGGDDVAGGSAAPPAQMSFATDGSAVTPAAAAAEGGVCAVLQRPPVVGGIILSVVAIIVAGFLVGFMGPWEAQNVVVTPATPHPTSNFTIPPSPPSTSTSTTTTLLTMTTSPPSTTVTPTQYSMSTTTQSPTTATPTTPTTSAPPPPSPSRITNVVIIMEENHGTSSIFNQTLAPFINSLASEFSVALNYSAVSHPSLPNYLALTSGSTHGITTDCYPTTVGCSFSTPNIGDVFDAAGLTWKMYAESMPSPCYGVNSGTYAVRHNPFQYYTTITNNTTRCNERVVAYSPHFAVDLAAGTLPNISIVSPNVCNDMHDCSVAVGDQWLKVEVGKLFNSSYFFGGGGGGGNGTGLLVVVWDEAETASPINDVVAIFAGPHARRNAVVRTPYTHYSLLRTVEAIFQLPNLTANDGSAVVMSDMLSDPPLG